MLAAAVAPLLLAQARQFEVTAPGGDTLCGRGGAFSFYHRVGTVNRLVVEFEGGGACWSSITCIQLAGACTTEIDVDKGGYLNGPNSGIHDMDDTRNPFRDWYHVFVPYCTCDAHTGINDHNYGLSGTVHHRGHTNFLAVLDWMKANFPTNPEIVTATGCSAGSLGSLAKWPFLKEAYPSAQTVVWGDSYIGVVGEPQWDGGFANWGLQLPNLPGYTGHSEYHNDEGCYLHNVSANAYPQARLGWYTSNADTVQTEFFSVGGGSGNWVTAMRAQVACMQKNDANERTFIAAGDAHCVSQDDGWYSVASSGVNLVEWVAGLVEGTSNTANVDCVDSGACNTTLRASDDGALKSAPLFTNYSSHIPYRR